MKGDEAVRRIQNLLTYWNLDLEHSGSVDVDIPIEAWWSAFHVFVQNNKDRPIKELHGLITERWYEKR